jgi:TRAP-type C4-dicarboxylate transport system permease small subunit
MRRFLSLTEYVAAFFLLAIALLVSLNVVLRYFFAVQIPDNHDFSKILQAIALFWGIALATYYGTHICVDIVWEWLDVDGRRRLDIVATLATLVFLVPLAWMTWVKVFTMGTQATTDLRLPLAPFYGVAAVGATATVVLCLLRIGVLLRGRERDLRPAAPGEEG